MSPKIFKTNDDVTRYLPIRLSKKVVEHMDYLIKKRGLKSRAVYVSELVEKDFKEETEKE